MDQQHMLQIPIKIAIKTTTTKSVCNKYGKLYSNVKNAKKSHRVFTKNKQR